MKCDATESNSLSSTVQVSSGSHGGAKYTRAYDDRKRPVRGLWIRGEKFYAQLSITDTTTGEKKVKRVPLSATTTGAAKKEMDKLKLKREENALPVLGRTPKFSEYADSYFAHFELLKGAKRGSTIEKEKGIIELWKAHLGETRLNHITLAQINAMRAKRQAAGMKARTVNLDVIALRNVLKKAVEDGHLKSLPMHGMRPLKAIPPKRRFISMEEIEKVCTEARELSKNGQQFTDYVKLMAFCGSRRDETLRLKWSDVDWGRKQLTVGADGLAKNHESRIVDFNPALESHLADMLKRRAPDSQWLFPSPQRGNKDIHAKTFKETLNEARESTVPDFNFHDCRHYFISKCVMAGIDFMTISEWVGHRDGGVLIGKVYGHLANDHRQAQAQKVSLD